MKYSKYILILFFSCPLIGNVNAQPGGVDSISNIKEAVILHKIQAAYNQLEYTSFKVKYHYKKSDKADKVLDSSSADYYMHDGMMKGVLNSGSEMISNSRYSLMISHDDSMISISKAVVGSSMFQLNLFDSLFRQANIMGFERKVKDDSTYSLKIIFKPSAFYKDYEITYNNRFLIKKIRIEYPDNEFDDKGNPAHGNRKNALEVHYSNYRKQSFDVGIFSESKYVKKNENGQFIGAGLHATFQVIVNESDL